MAVSRDLKERIEIENAEMKEKVSETNKKYANVRKTEDYGEREKYISERKEA